MTPHSTPGGEPAAGAPTLGSWFTPARPPGGVAAGHGPDGGTSGRRHHDPGPGTTWARSVDQPGTGGPPNTTGPERAEAAGGQQAGWADLATSARRVASVLEGGHVDHEAVLAGLAELVAAVAGCCQALETRLADDPIGYPQRATRRLVQATGQAEALATRLADVVTAMRHPSSGT